MAQTLQIARFSPSCSVLGPGRRGVVWVQGCERHCKGCAAPQTWDKRGGQTVSVEYLAEYFTQNEALEGLTFSGGEPFLQATALAELVDRCKEKRTEFTFLAYTGYTLKELLSDAHPEWLSLLACLDILIDGEYRENEHENLLWRGSQNQNVWFLTPRYQSDWASKVHETGVHLELEMDDETIHIMGIPPRNFRSQLDKIVKELGLKQTE